MELHGHLNALLFGILSHLFPVGKKLFLPLPVEYGLQILGKGRDGPVGIPGAVAVPGTS